MERNTGWGGDSVMDIDLIVCFQICKTFLISLQIYPHKDMFILYFGFYLATRQGRR